MKKKIVGILGMAVAFFATTSMTIQNTSTNPEPSPFTEETITFTAGSMPEPQPGNVIEYDDIVLTSSNTTGNPFAGSAYVFENGETLNVMSKKAGFVSNIDFTFVDETTPACIDGDVSTGFYDTATGKWDTSKGDYTITFSFINIGRISTIVVTQQVFNFFSNTKAIGGYYKEDEETTTQFISIGIQFTGGDDDYKKIVLYGAGVITDPKAEVEWPDPEEPEPEPFSATVYINGKSSSEESAIENLKANEGRFYAIADRHYIELLPLVVPFEDDTTYYARAMVEYEWDGTNTRYCYSELTSATGNYNTEYKLS